MTAPRSLAEVATLNSTGQAVRVLRRRSVAHDEQIMAALESAGHFVIGTPQGFRYRRAGKPRFTRPALNTVFLVNDDGTATASLPAAYFYAHYTITDKRTAQ